MSPRTATAALPLSAFSMEETMWEVAFHAEYAPEFEALEVEVREAIFARIGLLRAAGPSLGRPYVDSVKGSRFSNMKGLRVVHRGQPWRVLFAFDPGRRAVLLVGGNKAGDKRWHETGIAVADDRYGRHLGGKAMSTVRAEDVLARMSPESRARVAELSEELIAEYAIFLELKGADDLTRATPEYRAKFDSLPEECRTELVRLEADKLRRYVGAMGGKSRASAEFPDGPTLVLDE